MDRVESEVGLCQLDRVAVERVVIGTVSYLE